MSAMFSSVRNYVYDRRRGFGLVAGVAGGAYLLVKYAKSKLGEMQEKMMTDREARENLRRRFQQNQDDCNFTVLALLPTIGNQILEIMDVEKLTSVLQKRSATGRAAAVAAAPQLAVTEPQAEQSTVDAIADKGDSGSGAPLLPGAGVGRDAGLGVNGPAQVGSESAEGEGDSEAAVTARPDLAESSLSSYLPDPTDPADTPLPPSEAASSELAPGEHAPPQPAAPKSYAAAAAEPPTDTSTAPVPSEPENEPETSETVPSRLGDSSYIAPTPMSQSLTDSALGLSEEIPASTSAESTSFIAVENGDAQTEEERQHAGVGFGHALEGSRRKSPPPPLPLSGRIAEPGILRSLGTIGVGVDVVEAEKLSKLELWNEVKILSFSRSITSIYVVCLLALQTHIQLNLLGRYNYVSSVLELAEARVDDSRRPGISLRGFEEAEPERRGGISLQTERKYLTFSWWLLHQGWKEVAERVTGAVKNVLGPQQLKAVITPDSLWTLLQKVRAEVEREADDSSYSFATALFPDSEVEELDVLRQGGIPDSDLAIDDELRRLLDETEDFVDSEDFVLVRKLCLDKLFSVFTEALSSSFKAPVGALQQQIEASAGPNGEFVHPQVAGRIPEASIVEEPERTARLASLLPAVARQSHLVLNGMPNEYVESLNDVRELLEFSAVVYSSFDKSTIDLK